MTTYTSDLNTIDNPTTGNAAPAAWGDGVRDNFLAIGEALVSFTPSMSFSGGGSLTIGNGAIAGVYKEVGKLMLVNYELVVGSTTTFGTGTWRFLLPNSRSVSSSYTQLIVATSFDSSTSLFSPGAAEIGRRPGLTDKLVVHANGVGLHTTTSPFTWATGDVLTMQGLLTIA